jgi:outer membrane protein OmpA-like peptidoglycan-associated protein
VRTSTLTTLFTLLISVTLLAACASSDVSRDAAANIDTGVQNAKNLASDFTQGDIRETYQNASQTSKGALIGGSAGAVTGMLAPGIGVVAGTATGAILGASYGRYIDAYSSLQDQLENRGAVVAVLGDQVLIVLPSARIFNPMTATVKQPAYSTLNLVAQYVNSYTKMLVKIAAFTDDSGSKRVDVALSQQQAQQVAKVLTAYGVNARLLYAEGYGGDHLVQQNALVWDGNDNYRVEITLEKLDT